MSNKVVNIRKEVLLTGALYFVPILIVFGVLSIDLYINVQRWRYDYKTIKVKRDVSLLVQKEKEAKSFGKHQRIAEGKNSKRWMEVNSGKEGVVDFLKSILYLPFLSEPVTEQAPIPEEQDAQQKEEDLNFGIQTMMAEIEALKAEKTRLENLQNLTRLGYQLGLVSPKPEQIVRITYSPLEREKLIQTASTTMLFPEKPQKIDKPPTTVEGPNPKSFIENIFDVLDKITVAFQNKFLNDLTAPVNAESQETFSKDFQINKNQKKGISQLPTSQTKDIVDIDSLEEFLFEKF